jgi:hypothetical protein
MRGIIMDIMVEVISFLGVATKEVKRGRTSESIPGLKSCFSIKIYPERYLRKLIGNTDVEDALQRLDRLTLEEAHMAAAELLRISHNIESGMIRVDEGVKGVGRNVQDVGDGVQDVLKTVQVVDNKLDQVDRESSTNVITPFFNPHKSSQGIRSENAFKLGSLLQIRQLTITLHATLNMKEQLNGSFAEVFSTNGNLRILFCGFTENVCSSHPSKFHQSLTMSNPIAGAGKSILWLV